MKQILIFACTFFMSISLCGQNDTTEKLNIIKQSTDANETILTYEKFLRDETTLHRTYTQEYYSMILTLLTGIGIVIGSILTWMNWKSKESIRNQVNEQFKETVQMILDEKLVQVDVLVRNLKEKSGKQFEEINKMILELSLKSEKINHLAPKFADDKELPDINKLKGKKILWVDDWPDNNDYTIKILKQAGIDFDLALDTEAGLELLNKNKYDLVISDMGRANNRSAGLDLIRLMKEREIKTPIIICASSNAIKNYGKEAIKLGAQAATNSITGALNSIQKILSIE